jgi:hypothetical protein
MGSRMGRISCFRPAELGLGSSAVDVFSASVLQLSGRAHDVRITELAKNPADAPLSVLPVVLIPADDPPCSYFPIVSVVKKQPMKHSDLDPI